MVNCRLIQREKATKSFYLVQAGFHKVFLSDQVLHFDYVGNTECPVCEKAYGIDFKIYGKWLQMFAGNRLPGNPGMIMSTVGEKRFSGFSSCESAIEDFKRADESPPERTVIGSLMAFKEYLKTKYPGSVWLDRINDQQKSGFPFLLSPHLLSLADPADSKDPILLQFILQREENSDEMFVGNDPLAEQIHSPSGGLVHRYRDRLLVLTTGRCRAYCRFCTRQRTVSTQAEIASPDSVADYLSSHNEITEVILSGGDPLTLPDEKINDFLLTARNVRPEVSLRIHSRILTSHPDRITEEFCDMLRSHYPVTFVTHFNHPVEVTDKAVERIKMLRMSGVLVLNQSVLLKYINDSEDILVALNHKLYRSGCKPYYLHQCDEVNGTAHFHVSPLRGVELMRKIRRRLSGAAIPAYTIDLPGGGGKVPGDRQYLQYESPKNDYDSSFSMKQQYETESKNLTCEGLNGESYQVRSRM